MIDQAAPSDIPHSDGAEPRVAALEERVRQLEQVVAALQDTRALEERVVERVSTQVKPAQAAGAAESDDLLVQASRHILPAAVSVLADQAAVQAGLPPSTPRQSWILVGAYAELRAIVRLYLDPRFRLSWQARLGPLILLPAIAFSGLWLPGIAFLNTITLNIGGTLIEKVVDLLLAYVLFHVLHREATRYRATSPDLPPSLRL
jgi:hypothetical protein